MFSPKRILFPSSFFSRSKNGQVHLNGVFADPKGRPAKAIVVRLGNRLIRCRHTEGLEFGITFKTRKRLVLSQVIAITEEKERIQIGSRLVLVSHESAEVNFPDITEQEYQKWIRLYECPNPIEKQTLNQELSGLKDGASFSIIVDVTHSQTERMYGIVASLRNQFYDKWDLVVIVTARDKHDFEQTFTDLGVNLQFVVVNSSEKSQACRYNQGIEKASGDTLFFLGEQDRLSPHSLLSIALARKRHRQAVLFFGDQDEYCVGGLRRNPFFKKSWDSSLLLQTNYIGNAFAIRGSFFHELGGFTENQQLDPMWDLLLRASQKREDADFVHVPHVILHKLKEAETISRQIRRQIHRELQTIENNLPDDTWFVTRSENSWRPRKRLPSPPPLISLIMPSACKLEYLKPCLAGILEKTTYSSIEIILVVNKIRYTVEEQADYLQSIKDHPLVRIVSYEDSLFNFSYVVNLGVGESKGDILCLLNDDLEVITPDWLESMVEPLFQADTGAVGTKLYYPDGSVQHSGVFLGMNGLADHAEKGLKNHQGYFNRQNYIQQLSCVTAGCMTVKRHVFDEVGGFDESFPQAFNDIDFCIKIRERGYKIIWTPHAEMYHHESVSVGLPKSAERKETFRSEINAILEKRGDALVEDSAYNPNLSNSPPYYRLAFPPRQPLEWKNWKNKSWANRFPRKKSPGKQQYSPDKVNVFSHFDVHGKIDEYVLFYLSELKRLGWVTIFVTSCKSLPEGEYEKVAPFTHLIVHSNGDGRDWGNFALGLKSAHSITPPKRLLLTNDSVYALGPLDTVFESIEALDSDFQGITDSPQHRYHLQSYFLHCGYSLCSNTAFIRFWESFIPQSDKELIIERNEIDFTQYFMNLGFEPEAIFPYPALESKAKKSRSLAGKLARKGTIMNPSHFFCDILLDDYDCPFVKIELLRDNPSEIPNLAKFLSKIEIKNKRTSNMVERHLRRVSRQPQALAV